MDITTAPLDLRDFDAIDADDMDAYLTVVDIVSDYPARPGVIR